MAVTADTTKQVGEHLYGDRKPVSDWLLTDVESTADLSAVIPSGIKLDSTVTR